MTPLYMTNLFTHRFVKQQNKALKVPLAKKECYAKCFAVSGANIIWNSLHEQLRTIDSLGTFKSELRKAVRSFYLVAMVECPKFVSSFISLTFMK